MSSSSSSPFSQSLSTRSTKSASTSSSSSESSLSKSSLSTNSKSTSSSSSESSDSTSSTSPSSSSTGKTFVLANAEIDQVGSQIILRIFGIVIATEYISGFSITSNEQPVSVTRAFKIGEENGYSLISLRVAPRIEKDARVEISYDRETGNLYFEQTPVA